MKIKLFIILYSAYTSKPQKIIKLNNHRLKMWDIIVIEKHTLIL